MNNRQPGPIPRKTTINDQPHMLAYINPQEAMMLKSMGGTGQPGPGGIPAFPPDGDYGYDEGAGQGSGQGEGPANGFSNPANDPNASFDAFGNTYGTQEEAQAADVGDQQSAAQAGFEEGFGKEKGLDALSLFENKINNPVEQKGVLGLLSKFSPLSMLGKYAVKNQNLSALSQLKDPNQKVEKSFLGKLFSGDKAKTHSHYSPVFDQGGNIVGSASIGVDKDGNESTMGYRGDRTVSVFGPPDVQGYVTAMNEAGQGGPDSPGGSEGPPPIIIDDDTEESGETTSKYNPEDFLIKNLDIRQPETTVAGEVESIYNQGGVVSLDPFNQLRNRM